MTSSRIPLIRQAISYQQLKAASYLHFQAASQTRHLPETQKKPTPVQNNITSTQHRQLNNARFISLNFFPTVP